MLSLQPDAPVGRQVAQHERSLSGRLAHGQAFDPFLLPESEEEGQGALRQVGRPRPHFPNLRPSTCREHHSGADRSRTTCVVGRETERKPPPGSPVLVRFGELVRIDDDEVQVAVEVQVGDGRAAAGAYRVEAHIAPLPEAPAAQVLE